jgi:serine/threonine protein kinase
VRSRNNKKSI